MTEEQKGWNRQRLLAMPEMAHIREALSLAAEYQAQNGKPWNIMRPIRETPLHAFFDKSPNSMWDMRLNPNLPALWFHEYGIRIGDLAQGNAKIAGKGLKEAVNIPTTLSILKIADEIIEGAEPWSDWKSYSRLVPMDTPKVNVPKTKYTSQVGGQTTDTINIFKETSQGKTPVIGGEMEVISLDCSGAKNSYRGTIQVSRNDVKDNNFLAVEQPLKNAGNLFYYLVGVKVIDVPVASTTTNTDTKANLDDPSGAGASQAFFEAVSNVIRNKFPTQKNKADTMFINPLDAWKLIATAGTGGFLPMINRFILGPMPQGPEKDVINDSGLATSLGLRNVWETPQIAAGTVLLTKRDVASVTGLREDLTLENYDLTVGGLYNTDLVIRFDSQFGYEDGSFKITAF